MNTEHDNEIDFASEFEFDSDSDSDSATGSNISSVFSSKAQDGIEVYPELYAIIAGFVVGRFIVLPPSNHAFGFLTYESLNQFEHEISAEIDKVMRFDMRVDELENSMPGYVRSPPKQGLESYYWMN